MDEHGKIVLINSEAERIFGYARAEILGQPVERLMPERFRSAHVTNRLRFGQAPATRPMGAGLELYGLRKDGSEFPMEISLAPISAKHGPLVYAGIRDVTDRRRGEQELERLRRQQELLLNSVTEGVIGVDEHGRITVANPAAAKLLGHRTEELIGQHEHELFHRTRADGTPYAADACPIHRSIEDGTIHHAAGEVFTRKSGSTFPVEYTSAPIREKGRIVGASLIFTDVSERLRAESVVRESNRRVLSIYEAMPEAFFSLDRDWRITYLNPAAQRLVGLLLDQAAGKPFWSVVPDLGGTQAETEARRALQERGRGRVESHSATLGKWLEATVYGVEDNVSLYLRDVTEIRRGEEALRQASIARPLARRIVQDIVEQGAVAHQTLTQVGRKLAAETPSATLDEHLMAYREMGLGKIEVDKREGGRYSFTGSDLLERRPESRVATCSFTLGYLSEAVSHVHRGEPTLGTEIECQSRGAAKCRFVVQVKKPEEGLARRVKELI